MKKKPSRQTAVWPTHGYAVNARNDTAERAYHVLDEVVSMAEMIHHRDRDADTQKLLESLLFGLFKTAVSANEIMRDMEAQGAPTRTRPPGFRSIQRGSRSGNRT